MTSRLALAEPPAAPEQINAVMAVDAAQRAQTALEWACARLARGRRGDLAVEHLRWLDWLSCVIAGEVGIAPPTPKIEAVPELDIDPANPPVDARGRRRSAGNLPGKHNPRKGVSPNSKGRKYPPDPPTVEEIVRFLEYCPPNQFGARMRALVIVLWRSGLRIGEALALEESDLRRQSGEIVVRCGKGGKRRIVGMDPWGWQQLQPWLEERLSYPTGPVFCVLDGPTAGRALCQTQVRKEMRKIKDAAGIRRRWAPHQLRHKMTLDWVREGQPIVHMSRQLGHSDLAITTRYTAGLSPEEVTAVSASRAAPVMSVPNVMGAHDAS